MDVGKIEHLVEHPPSTVPGEPRYTITGGPAAGYHLSETTDSRVDHSLSNEDLLLAIGQTFDFLVRATTKHALYPSLVRHFNALLKQRESRLFEKVITTSD